MGKQDGSERQVSSAGVDDTTATMLHIDLDAFFGCEPALPRHVASGAVQILLAAVLGVGQQHQHALRQPAVEVEQHGVGHGGAHGHAAALLGDATGRQAGDAQHLGRQIVLNASGARQK